MNQAGRKRKRARKRSAIVLDLRTPKYRPRVVADKRRKVTLGRGTLSVRGADGQWRVVADIKNWRYEYD